MAGSKDILREEAFKTIIHDIEKHREMYTNKQQQERQIGKLIDSKNLRIKKGNAKIETTPTAAQLRGLLMVYVGQNKNDAYQGGDVFKHGSYALDPDQRQVLQRVRPKLKLEVIEELKAIASPGSRAATRPVQDLSADDELNSTPKASENRGKEGGSSGHCCGLDKDGEMVLCANENCKRHRFHLACVGLPQKPTEQDSWYCADCQADDKINQLVSDESISRRPEGKKRRIEEALGAGEVAAVDRPGSSAKRPMLEFSRDDFPVVRGKRTNVDSIMESINASINAKRKRMDDNGSDRPSKRQDTGAAIDPALPADEPGTTENQRSQTQEQSMSAAQQSPSQPSVPETAKPQVPVSASSTEEPQQQAQSAAASSTELPAVHGDAMSTGSESEGKYPRDIDPIGGVKGLIKGIVSNVTDLALNILIEYGLHNNMTVPALATMPTEDTDRLYSLILGKSDHSWRQTALNHNLRLHETTSALIGAALYDKVLLKPIPWQTPQDVLKMLSPYHEEFDKLLDEKLPDSTTHRSRFGNLAYLVWQSGKNVLDNKQFVKEKIEPIAEDLGRAILWEAKSHLQQIDPKLKVQGSSAAAEAFWTRCAETAKDLCLDALILHGKMNAAPKDYDIKWLPSGATVPVYWAQQLGSFGGAGGEIEVVMSVFPCIKFVSDNGELKQLCKAQVWKRA